MLDIKDIKWQLDVAETLTKLDLRIMAIFHLLAEKGLWTLEECGEKVNEFAKQEPYVSALKEVEDGRKMLQEIASEPDAVKDLMKKLFEKAGDKK